MDCEHFSKTVSSCTAPPVPSSPSASSAAHNDIQSVQEKKKTGGGEYFPLISTEAELAESSAQGWVEGEPKSRFVMHGHTLPGVVPVSTAAKANGGALQVSCVRPRHPPSQR